MGVTIIGYDRYCVCGCVEVDGGGGSTGRCRRRRLNVLMSCVNFKGSTHFILYPRNRRSEFNAHHYGLEKGPNFYLVS